MKAYFMSKSSHCLLVWINQTRSLNNHINILHEKALHLVYNDFESSFSKLLGKDNSAIHQVDLQTLTIELFKVKNNLAP